MEGAKIPADDSQHPLVAPFDTSLEKPVEQLQSNGAQVGVIASDMEMIPTYTRSALTRL
ncbi:hypothetical protein [Ktedonospora formicarum]|uniref:Uncharacterized protein n=1 Tax=Ktedonospora formicarum TaxID=2778364 RepID=A0A8J3MS65_9CHLR|nr:hypothetical protein [Ktedonospora formicarum]GHO45760.1 hypothetical protein KSX_39230 [Ktedonospora formicarum]